LVGADDLLEGTPLTVAPIAALPTAIAIYLMPFVPAIALIFLPPIFAVIDQFRSWRLYFLGCPPAIAIGIADNVGEHFARQ
jgi:hypothetical protein